MRSKPDYRLSRGESALPTATAVSDCPCADSAPILLFFAFSFAFILRLALRLFLRLAARAWGCGTAIDDKLVYTWWSFCCLSVCLSDLTAETTHTAAVTSRVPQSARRGWSPTP